MNIHRLLPLLILATACTKNESRPPVAAESYPLPTVAATITDPAERASVICARFWDKAVFPPSATDSVSPALEQALADFAAIAPLASEPDSVARGIGELLRKGGRDYIMPLAERYLLSTDSPLRSDEIFLMFLQAAPGWERTELLLPEIMKNRVGSTAADFEFIDTRGNHSSLSSFVGQHGATLVYFFDSQCDLCKDLIPAAELAAGDRALLAICPADNATDFDAAAQLFPPQWTVARDCGRITADDLYHFPVLPAAYLLAPDGTVLARNIPL